MEGAQDFGLHVAHLFEEVFMHFFYALLESFDAPVESCDVLLAGGFVHCASPRIRFYRLRAFLHFRRCRPGVKTPSLGRFL